MHNQPLGLRLHKHVLSHEMYLNRGTLQQLPQLTTSLSETGTEGYES